MTPRSFQPVFDRVHQETMGGNPSFTFFIPSWVYYSGACFEVSEANDENL